MKIRRDGILETQPVSVQETIIKTVYDIGATDIYIGTAPLGTATSSAAWLIKKTTLSGGNPVSALWSSNTAIWDNRTIESYS
jgi:hypothetical protein